MTSTRKMSIDIALKALAKHGVLNIEYFMREHKDELIKTFKEAESSEHWSLIPAKIDELLNAA